MNWTPREALARRQHAGRATLGAIAYTLGTDEATAREWLESPTPGRFLGDPPRKPSQCHPDRPRHATSRLCAECYAHEKVMRTTASDRQRERARESIAAMKARWAAELEQRIAAARARARAM